MIKEIGSEFWISDIATSYTDVEPDWLNSWGNYILTSSGRGAISLLLQKIKPKHKTALLPAYICESVITPFISHGYACYYYDINNEFESIIDEEYFSQDIGVFLHMGYFGFQTNRSLEHAIVKLKDVSTIIIEDITHTLFSVYSRSAHNNFYIGSLRKWIGLPSGGFLASPHREVNIELSSDFTFSNIRKHALLHKAKYVEDSNEDLKPQFLGLFAEAEKLVDEDILPYKIDELSETIINNCDINVIKERRKDNYKFLQDELRDFNLVRPVFNVLPDQVCPFFYPVYINGERSKIRQVLSDNKIYCPIHWPIPEQVRGLEKYKASYIYDNILSIPCDQRYGINDMSRIVEVLRTI